MTGMTRSKPQNRDFQNALSLITEVGGDLKKKSYLSQLVEASAEHDAARAAAESAIAESRSEAASAAQVEGRALSAQSALASDTAAAERRLGQQREEIARDRKQIAELSKALTAKDDDLTQREAALRRAFSAYYEGTGK